MDDGAPDWAFDEALPIHERVQRAREALAWLRANRDEEALLYAGILRSLLQTWYEEEAQHWPNLPVEGRIKENFYEITKWCNQTLKLGDFLIYVVDLNNRRLFFRDKGAAVMCKIKFG